MGVAGVGWSVPESYIDVPHFRQRRLPRGTHPREEVHLVFEGSDILLLPVGYDAAGAPTAFRPFVQDRYFSVEYFSASDSFQATDASGTRYVFDHLCATSEAAALDPAEPNGERYYLSRASDTNFNLVQYTYEFGGSDAEIASGEPLCSEAYLTRIRYNYSPLTGWLHSIDLSYSPRAVESHGGVFKSAAGDYQAEGVVLRRHRKLLTAVDVKRRDAEILYHYDLSYDSPESESTFRPLLLQVARDGHPLWKFSYSSVAGSREDESPEDEEPSIGDSISRPGVPLPVDVGAVLGKTQPAFGGDTVTTAAFRDLTGDGVPDIAVNNLYDPLGTDDGMVVVYPGEPNPESVQYAAAEAWPIPIPFLGRSTGWGFVNHHLSYSPSQWPGLWSFTDSEIELTDLNGDGLTDVIVGSLPGHDPSTDAWTVFINAIELRAAVDGSAAYLRYSIPVQPFRDFMSGTPGSAGLAGSWDSGPGFTPFRDPRRDETWRLIHHAYGSEGDLDSSVPYVDALATFSRWQLQDVTPTGDPISSSPRRRPCRRGGPTSRIQAPGRQAQTWSPAPSTSSTTATPWGCSSPTGRIPRSRWRVSTSTSCRSQQARWAPRRGSARGPRSTPDGRPSRARPPGSSTRTATVWWTGSPTTRSR